MRGRFGKVTAVVLAAACGWAFGHGRAEAADLTSPAVIPPPPVAEAAPSGWSFTMTPYGWVSWLDGNMTIRGRNFDVAVDPKEILQDLDAIWMSYLEARNGPFAVFSDIMFAKLSASGSGLITRQPRPNVTATLGASVGASYKYATIEAGGSYELTRWGGPTAAAPGGIGSLEILAGARYWYQQAEATVKLKGTLNIADLVVLSRKRVLVGSGDVDWVDPFVGARATWEFMPGQKLAIRGDVGGFDVGSKFSWQAMATYNFNFANVNGVSFDGYLGFRALSVDYTQGSGNTRYKYDVVQYGPLAGLTVRF